MDRRAFLTKCGVGLAGILTTRKTPAIVVRSMIGARNVEQKDEGIAPAPLYWGLCFTAKEPNVIVNMEKIGSSPVVGLETSFDGETWTPFDADGGTTPITLPKRGSCVYFKAGSTGNTGISSGVESTNYRHFTLSGRCAASGNMMSLLNGDVAIETISSNMAFGNTFRNCTTLTSAPELPATTISSYCYARMFQGCTSLIKAPSVIPGVALQGYAPCGSMFQDCTSLVNAPRLPAMTLGKECYRRMFLGCKSLVNAPELPATTLATNCYSSMFQDCTSLVNAPKLPAMTLKNSCYNNMFRGCSSLVNAPNLPATTLVNDCYGFMFANCRNIEKIAVSFTEWLSGATNYWLASVAANGTFSCPTALGTNETISRGANNCPASWTVENVG